MGAINYTPEQMEARNNSRWTPVQAILGPLQFVVFIISVILIIHYLSTGDTYGLANASVLLKIALLWAITITGMLWEKEVFGQWFMAPEFFWEDLFNTAAMIAHNLYFYAAIQGWSQDATMSLMLVAYSTYLINFAQFTFRGIRARAQAEYKTTAVPETS